MSFSARALKKNVDIVVKNKSKCGLSWSVLLPTTSMCHYSFPKHFFVLFLHIKRVCKIFESKVRRVQAANLHNAAREFSSPSRCFQLSNIYFVVFDIVVKNKSNLVN